MAAASIAPALSAELKGVRFGVTSPSETRIVIDLDEEAPFGVVADGDKVRVEFPNSRYASPLTQGAGHIASYQAVKDGKTVALLFVLKRPAAVADKFTIPGSKSKSPRVVIDLKDAESSTTAANDQSAATPAPSTTVAAPSAPAPQSIEDILAAATVASTIPPSVSADPAPPAAPAPEKPKLKVIVIDAGHGGGDPGASSSGGVLEKSVTLAAARRLAEILEAGGRYQIVLTRADDSRLALDQRATIARKAEANLFISLHADAIEDAGVRGGSVYTISEGGTDRSEQEAKSSGNFNNVYGVDIEEISKGDPALNRMIYDQATNLTASESGRYANILLKRLKGVTPLLNNSHRKADLKVLLSPDVPAVLFELAFISNDLDAANLTSKVWRTKTMTAVANSIDDYFRVQSEAAAATAPAAPAGR